MHGLLLFHLKGLKYEFVFYETGRNAGAWSFIIPFARITVRIRVLRSACAWSFIIPFGRIIVRVCVLRGGAKRGCMVFYYSICKDYSTYSCSTRRRHAGAYMAWFNMAWIEICTCKPVGTAPAFPYPSISNLHTRRRRYIPITLRILHIQVSRPTPFQRR